MTAYYNEVDPFAVKWLRNLIDAGLIAPGYVDDRSIEDVTGEDIKGFTQCHFFAGIGVWSYALRQAGWPDDRPVWTGSCPCQPFSTAGKKGGTADKRHLWPVWFPLIAQCQPTVVFGEQVSSAAGLGWLDAVSADLEGAGYAIGAADLCAASVGAPHIRQRLFWVADTDSQGLQGGLPGRQDTQREAIYRHAGQNSTTNPWARVDWRYCKDGKWRPTQPGTSPLAHGVAGRVGRLRAYGNAIVAPVACTFISAAMEVVK